jgi:hypothetical protein
MKTLAVLLILAAAPGFAAAQATKEDLKKLAKAGVSEDVILAYIKANGLATKPTSDDLVELKEAGLSDKLLAGILTPSEAAPAPAAATTPSTVYVERPASGYATGYLSVNPSYAYASSYCTPTYVRYYTGSFYRPYYSSYCRPYYGGSYYRSSYCGPRVSFTYSSSRSCRSGFSARVRW